MSTNEATVRVQANYQLHNWKQSGSKFTHLSCVFGIKCLCQWEKDRKVKSVWGP